MKIFNIQNPKNFFEKLAACSGQVYITDRNGVRIDYSNDRESQKFLSCLTITIPEIKLDFSDPDDFESMFRYALEMNIQ